MTETIKTKLKFERSSEKANALIGFVSINSSNGYMRGVRSDSKSPKKICVLDKKIAPQIMEHVLYDVDMVPMKKGTGYVVIAAAPCQFAAEIDSCVIKNAVYYVKVRFGNKTIIYNPLDGVHPTMRTLKGCIAALSERKDIANLPAVIEEFTRAANLVMLNFENDGHYVPKEDKQA